MKIFRTCSRSEHKQIVNKTVISLSGDRNRPRKIKMSPATKEESKKRKSSSGSSGSSPGKATSSVPDRAAMHAKVSRLEEEESRNRKAEEDAGLFARTVADIRKGVEQAYEAKTRKGAGGAKGADVTELRIRASLQVLTLKRLNRLDKLRARDSRDRTQQAKQKVDSLHLHLQNLLYEAMHLQKEITKCQQFRSGDEDIQMVSEEEFYRDAPDNISKSEETRSDEHKRKLARLEFEGATRREMSGALKKLESGREKLEDIIKTKRDNLASLRPQLQKILEATKPTQDYLKMPLTEEWEQAKLCRLLPPPLFVLYSQTSAYGEACDKMVKVEIIGDIEEARTFHTKKLLEEEDDDDSNNVTNEEEEESAKKSKRGRGGSGKSQQISKQEENLRMLLQRHPLQVRVRVALQAELPEGVLMTFGYLTRLKVISVKVTLEGGAEGESGGVLQSSLLLSHLLGPGDGGARSPNPANRFQLAEVGYPGGAMPARYSEEIGVLYRWAQLLGGLVHPEAEAEEGDEEAALSALSPSEPSELPASEDVSFSRVGEILKAVRDRVQARIALQKQVAQLEKAKHVQVEPSVPREAAGLFPEESGGGGGSRSSSGRSRIRNWTSVDWEQYTGLEVTRHLVEAGAVDGDDFFFRLQVRSI